MTIRSAWTLGRGFGPMGSYDPPCWSPDDPPVPPAPAPPAPPVPGVPFATFPTQASFDDRLNREARAILKDKYGLTEKQLDERLARAKELEDAEAARIKAQQTREQQLETEKTEAEARAKAADARAAEAIRQAEVTGMCARLGFKNLDYAIFEAGKPGNATKTTAELEAHFTEMAKDDGKKAALGLAVAAPELVPVPAGTAPVPPGGAPPAPPPPGGAPPVVPDVMRMSPQQFADHLRTHGA